MIQSDTGPFAIIPEWVLDHADLPHGAVRLYGVLGRYADDQGRCWPSRLTLARRLGCSTGTVDRWAIALVDAEALHVERRKQDAGHNLTNLWTIFRTDPQHRGGGGASTRGGGRTDAGRGAASVRPRTTEREPQKGGGRSLPTADLLAAMIEEETNQKENQQ